MNTRPYEESDESLVRCLLSSQNWDLPDLRSPHYVSRMAVCDGERAVAFGFGRLIAEAYLLIDKSWSTPAWRLAAIRQANKSCRSQAAMFGLDRAVTWVPQEIVRSYGKRLCSMGWEAIDRPSFVMEVR